MASFYTAADALIERDGEYLMIQEGKEHVEHLWNVPGGGVEHGETPVDGVKREVYEETGLQVEKVKGLVAVCNGRSSRDGHPVMVFVFSVEVEDGDPEPELDEEVYDAGFYTREEIDNMELRNDIIYRALEARETGDMLPPEAFSEYLHPYLDEEPGESVK